MSNTSLVHKKNYWKEPKWVDIWEAFVHNFWHEFFIQTTYKTVFTTKTIKIKTSIFAILCRISPCSTTRLWGLQPSHIRKCLFVINSIQHLAALDIRTFIISFFAHISFRILEPISTDLQNAGALLRCAYVNYIYFNLFTSLVFFYSQLYFPMQCTLFSQIHVFVYNAFAISYIFYLYMWKL